MESREGKLKFAIRMLQHVPGYAKDEMVKLVDDEEYEIREDVVSQIRKHQKEIEHEWPSELRNFIFAKLNIKPSKDSAKKKI